MYERLTEFRNGIWGLSAQAIKRGFDTYSVYSKLASYEDSGLSPEEVVEIKKYLNMWIEICKENNVSIVQFKKWAEAEQDGRVMMLPCKIGEKVYRYCNDAINEGTIINILLNVKTGEIGLEYEMSTCYTCSRSGTLGKNLFLTREAAEKALGGGQ